MNRCRICGNEQGNKEFVAREMMYGLRDEFEYFQCNECGCLQISAFPEDMSGYYPSGYYSFGKYDGKSFRGLLGSINRAMYKLLLSKYDSLKWIAYIIIGKTKVMILKDLELSVESRILDVGCGNGRGFLYPLAECGFKKILGCDPLLEKAIRYENGLKIENIPLAKIEGPFDIITYHHSFEHIPGPIENLKLAHQLLDDQGVCIIRIPTVDSYAWKHYGTNWAQLDAPRHFFLHSISSIRHLAGKTGFELFKIKYDSSHSQFSGSERYKRDIPASAPEADANMTRLLRKLRNKIRAIKLNREGKGDQAAFYLRKTDVTPGLS